MNMESPERRAFRPGAIVGGSIVLVVGVAMLLDRTGALDIRMGRMIAPFVLIILGSAMMFDKGGVKRGGSTSGLWLIGIGVWMMISQLHLWGLSYHTSWPLFIILMGLMIVIRSWR